MKFSLEELRSFVIASIASRNTDSDTCMTDADNSEEPFHDKLQSLITTPRPATEDAAIDFALAESTARRLVAAAKAADVNAAHWKILVLSIIRRRFHAKAPEARRIKRKMGEDDKCTDTVEGDGERLIFYLAIMCLRELALDTNSKMSDMSSKASDCLLRTAFLAGGTRDMCSLIELLTFDLLERGGHIQLHKDQGQKSAIIASMCALFGPGPGDSSLHGSGELDRMLSSGADMLDADLNLVRQGSSDENQVLQSTINTFLPHRERGNPRSKNSARNLVQKVAELLIWSKTSAAMSSPRFTQSMDTLKSIFQSEYDNSASNDAQQQRAIRVMGCIHTMQTIIRRFRQELNGAARAEGFSLCSSFLMDPATLTLSMIRRGKEGDIAALLKLAAKKSDRRVLKLIAKRHENPSKATPVESIVSLSRRWVPLPKEDEEIDEMRDLELAIQNATVRATIERLRDKVKLEADANNKSSVILASLDGTSVNNASAILVAAAMDPTFLLDEQPCNDEMKLEAVELPSSSIRLFIGADEYQVETLPNVIKQLDRMFKDTPATSPPSSASGNDAGIPASTKDVQNLIERHMKKGDRLLIFTAADLKLEQRVLQKLQSDKCSIHCHIGDEWSSRMEREGAKIGDVTATLVWDDYNDLDLHAICPGGTHISYKDQFWMDGEQVLGNLDVDMNAGGKESKEPVENIFFGDLEKNVEAPKGKYKVFVQNYSYHDDKNRDGDPVPWRVRVTMNGESKEYEGICAGTGDKSNVTVCEFEYNGRTTPLPEKVGSALKTSNLVAVTSSVGTTIDSLCQLAGVFDQHALLEQVRQLRHGSEGDGTGDGSSLMAARGSFHVTNRDRLYLNLSRLPLCFREEAGKSFGGPSLTKIVASSVAKRLVDQNTPVQALQQAGYPKEIVEEVKEQMKTFGL